MSDHDHDYDLTIDAVHALLDGDMNNPATTADERDALSLGYECGIAAAMCILRDAFEASKDLSVVIPRVVQALLVENDRYRTEEDNTDA